MVFYKYMLLFNGFFKISIREHFINQKFKSIRLLYNSQAV